MVLSGIWLVLMALLAVYFHRTKKIDAKTGLLKALLWTIPIPYIANTTGWFLAEVGRQPWIVFGLQKTETGVSTAVSAGAILTTLVGFTLIYGVLAVADVYLLVKFIKQGPEVTSAEPVDNVAKGASLWT